MLVLLVLGAIGCKEKQASKEVLFVCTHGAARSPIAAAYFNKIVGEQNLKYRAVFRGTEPDSVLTDGTQVGLRKDGLDIANWKPELVTDRDIATADRIITFDCKLTSDMVPENVEQWNGTPSVGKDYDKAREVIVEKVEHLIASLSKN